MRKWLLLTTMTAAMLAPAAQQGKVATRGGEAEAARTFDIPVVVELGNGVRIDSLAIGVQVTAKGDAPALAGRLSFQPAESMPEPTMVDTGVGPHLIALAWLKPFDPPLSGTVTLGTVRMNVPSGAKRGHTYALRITGANATMGDKEVKLEPAADSALSVR